MLLTELTIVVFALIACVLMFIVGYLFRIYTESVKNKKKENVLDCDVGIVDALEGVWFEYIPDSVGHHITIGELYFNAEKSTLAFDGTNYSDTLEPYCFFETLASAVDKNTNQYHYMFNSMLPGALDKKYAGYGTIIVTKNRSEYSVLNGHYISASVDGKPMSHIMTKLTVLQHKNAYRKVYNRDELKNLISLAKAQLDIKLNLEE